MASVKSKSWLTPRAEPPLQAPVPPNRHPATISSPDRPGNARPLRSIPVPGFATASVCALLTLLHCAAADGEFKLLPPDLQGGKPLLQTLAERRTTRDFIPTAELPPKVLSNLIWAAAGINRPETGGRTAPTAMNSQEQDLYVLLAKGTYRYEPKDHKLLRVSEKDLRALSSGQPFATNAPVTLLFVADLERMPKAKPEERERYAGIDAGYISQNVYLFCSSEGLGSVVHELDRVPLITALGLKPSQKIILAQAIGYPKPPEN